MLTRGHACQVRQALRPSAQLRQARLQAQVLLGGLQALRPALQPPADLRQPPLSCHLPCWYSPEPLV